VSNLLKAYIAGLVCISAIALLATSLLIPVGPRIAPDVAALGLELGSWAGIALWTLMTLLLAALPVQLPNGIVVAVATAPIIASMILGGPTAAAWVALIGATEMRELRGDVPWYGTLFNHAGIVLPAIVGGFVVGLVRVALAGSGNSIDDLVGVVSRSPFEDFVGAVLGAAVYFGLNMILVGTAVAMRTGARFSVVIRGEAALYANLATFGPLAWLMAQMYLVAWWASLLFTIPLYTTRVAYHRFVEMREMFTQTIGALAEAVDARDPYTSSHSRNVMKMSVDIGRVMRVSADGLEALEWGGLLHDVGKIGVKDAVLLKPDKLTRDERAEMNAHPTKGAAIISPVTKLAPVVPLIRHHHEWFNGSGYPGRLVGREIPKLARILAVADAFEAMTHERPYRMTPLSPEEALAELRRYAGIQFDPDMVEAFARTDWVRGVADPGRPNEARPVPMIREAAERMTATAGPGSAEPGAPPAENA
jgi:hypothetical protein